MKRPQRHVLLDLDGTLTGLSLLVLGPVHAQVRTPESPNSGVTMTADTPAGAMVPREPDEPCLVDSLEYAWNEFWDQVGQWNWWESECGDDCGDIHE